jgi:hypothetical protein
MVLENLHKNAAMAQTVVADTIPLIPEKPHWPSHDSLRNAIMTDPKLWPEETRRNLLPLLQRCL